MEIVIDCFYSEGNNLPWLLLSCRVHAEIQQIHAGTSAKMKEKTCAPFVSVQTWSFL